LLVAEDEYGYTAWHRAAERVTLWALETIWNWAMKLELKPHELLPTPFLLLYYYLAGILFKFTITVIKLFYFLFV